MGRWEIDQFELLLKCLEESGSLSSVVIIGSWAEWCYEESGILGPEYSFPLKTLDADVLIPRLGGDGTGFIETAKRLGFLYGEDRMTGSSRLFGMDGFEVEFLTPQRGDGRRPVPRPPMGVNPQQLSHLEVLGRFTLPLSVRGRSIIAPEPEAYALQKMVVNSRRRSKAESDREKILNILPHLDGLRFSCIYDSLTKREKHMADGFANPYGLQTVRDLPALVMAATPYSLGGGAETVEHAYSAIHASPARTPPQRRRAR